MHSFESPKAPLSLVNITRLVLSMLVPAAIIPSTPARAQTSIEQTYVVRIPETAPVSNVFRILTEVESFLEV